MTDEINTPNSVLFIVEDEQSLSHLYTHCVSRLNIYPSNAVITALTLDDALAHLITLSELETPPTLHVLLDEELKRTHEGMFITESGSIFAHYARGLYTRAPLRISGNTSRPGEIPIARRSLYDEQTGKISGIDSIKNCLEKGLAALLKASN